MARLAKKASPPIRPTRTGQSYGEIIFRRAEKISFADGETIFIFTRVPDLNERILRQTSRERRQLVQRARPSQKALSVLQSTTVYHCLVAHGDQPHNELLTGYVTRTGGATFIPVIIVPEINQVIYPDARRESRLDPPARRIPAIPPRRAPRDGQHAPDDRAGVLRVARRGHPAADRDRVVVHSLVLHLHRILDQERAVRRAFALRHFPNIPHRKNLIHMRM